MIWTGDDFTLLFNISSEYKDGSTSAGSVNHYPSNHTDTRFVFSHDMGHVTGACQIMKLLCFVPAFLNKKRLGSLSKSLYFCGPRTLLLVI